VRRSGFEERGGASFVVAQSSTKVGQPSLCVCKERRHKDGPPQGVEVRGRATRPPIKANSRRIAGSEQWANKIFSYIPMCTYAPCRDKKRKGFGDSWEVKRGLTRHAIMFGSVFDPFPPSRHTVPAGDESLTRSAVGMPTSRKPRDPSTGSGQAMGHPQLFLCQP